MILYEIQYLDVKEEIDYEKIIKETIKKCFKAENLLESKLYVSITLTTPKHIREYNKKYRNIDKSTDVLSFPMFEKEELETKIKNNKFENEDILGDVIISIEQVAKQAEEYGHNFERELSYMIVHSFYHLMGYDHMNEKDKQEMRKKEKMVIGDVSD